MPHAGPSLTVGNCLAPPYASEARLGQRKHVDRVACDDCDALLTALAGIAHGVCVRVVRECGTPELLAVFRVERAESFVVGGTDEHDAARRDRGPRAAGAARELFAFGELLVQ